MQNINSKERAINLSDLDMDLLRNLSVLCEDSKPSEEEQNINHTIHNIIEKQAMLISNEYRNCVYAYKLKSYDYSTYIHSVRVSVLSMIIGKILGYSQSTIKELGIAGLLHDIGKRYIPVEIITKPDKLDDIEKNIVAMHPAGSVYYIRKNYNLSKNILCGVYEHHERLDGSGYPRKLIGDEISRAGRIIAIADIFEAYSSERSYHNARSFKETVAYLKSCKGLDQFIVDKFIEHIDFNTDMVYLDDEQ